MTEAVAAPPPAADTQEATPTTEGGPRGHAAKMAEAMARLGRARVEPAPAAKPAPAAPPAKPAPATPAAQDDLRVAREQQETLRASRERVEAKKAAEQAQAKLAELAVFAEAKDPVAIVKALKARGVTLEQLAKGELESPDEEEEAEPEHVRTLRERVEAFEKREAEAQAAAARQKNLATVSKVIADATELPLLQSYGISPEKILELCEKHYVEHEEMPNVADIAAGFHRSVMADLDQILGTDAALEAWLTRPEVRQRALKALKVKNPSAGPASDEGANERGNDASPANSSTAAAGGAPRQARTLTHEDRRAAALDDLRKRMSNRS